MGDALRGQRTSAVRLLGVIGAAADLFPAAGGVARRAVNDIVRAQLAAEGTGLDAVRAMHALLGAFAFAEALDGLSAPAAARLLLRVDPNAPVLQQPDARVRTLLALAEGSREPAPAVKRRVMAPSAPAPSAPAPSPPASPSPRRRRVTGHAALRVSEDR